MYDIIDKIHLRKDSRIFVNFLKSNRKLFSFKSLKNDNTHVKKYYDFFKEKYDDMYKNKIHEVSKDVKQERNEVTTYFDNLDSCEFFSRRDDYKTNFTGVLRMIKKRNPEILTEIYQNYDFTSEEKNKVEKFISDLNSDKIGLDDIVEWINLHGTKIVRSIYIYMLEGRLPEEANSILGSNPELYGHFTSLDIQNDIELNIANVFDYQYKMDGINLELRIHHHYDNFKPSPRLLERIFFLNYIVQKPNISLTLWYSHRKKVLKYDVEKKYIGPREINSGCTTFTGSSVNKVSIWRSEELSKLVIHEIFHSLDLEQRSGLHDLNEFIYNHFDIRREDNSFNFFESYVETFADLINTFFIIIHHFDSLEGRMKSKLLGGRRKKGLYGVSKTVKKKRKSKKKTNKNKPNTPGIKKKLIEDKLEYYMEFMDMERMWIMFQAAKVLNYFEFTSFSDFYYPNGIDENKKTKRYLQNSNVFSYIIVRSLIFFRLEEFMKICWNNNSESNPMQHNIQNNTMIDFMKKSLNNNNYQKTINKLIKLIKSGRKKEKVNDVVWNSMRMTSLELK
jgi:hypothetical protein